MRFRSRLLVDLNILTENYQKLKKICPNNEVLFMVKADAYGHGILPICRHAVTELGIKEFGCATLGEAIHLRDELFDLEFEIYVFSDVQLGLQEKSEIYLNRRIIPILSNMDDLKFILDNSDFKNFPLSVKFNTGMNRLGIDYDRVDEVISLIKSKGRKSIYHLLTHFSSSSLSMKTNKRNIEQKARFKAIKEAFIEAGIELERTSIANSGAIEQGHGLEETHIRPGLMMYGPSSLIKPIREQSLWDGRVISSLETYVLKVFPVKKGQPVGYGATPVPYEGLCAIIALGYGDGFSTRYVGATLTHNGHLGKVVGRVNMDMAQVLFKNEAANNLKVDDRFIVWRNDPSDILRLSDETATIPYEIFLHLTNRVPKVYV